MTLAKLVKNEKVSEKRQKKERKKKKKKIQLKNDQLILGGSPCSKWVKDVLATSQTH